MPKTINFMAILCLVLALSACATQSEDPTSEAPAATQASDADESAQNQSDYADKKIVFVNSYHAGDPWADRIEAGFNSIVEQTGAETLFVRMDTKSKESEEELEMAGVEARDAILEFDPDVVVVCDDNAQKYLVVPHLMESELPIVFCGVNWDAEVYGYPTDHITGIIEIELVENLVNHLEHIAQGGDRIAYVGTTSNTDARNVAIYNERFFNDQLQVYAASTYQEFQDDFEEAQRDHDIVLLGNFSAISDWPSDEAETYMLENTTVPTGTVMVNGERYALLTLQPIPEEQGEWSADAALQILDGSMPNDIAVAENEQGKLLINLNISEHLDVALPVDLLRQAEIYGEDANE